MYFRFVYCGWLLVKHNFVVQHIVLEFILREKAAAILSSILATLIVLVLEGSIISIRTDAASSARAQSTAMKYLSNVSEAVDSTASKIIFIFAKHII